MDYKLTENKLSVNDFMRLRKSAGWGALSEKQVEAGLKNSIFAVTAEFNDEVIGMGRIVGDGFTICYIQDVIVLPEYQGMGIGKAIIERLISNIKENALPGTYVTAGLFSAKGKEAFYEKFGFVVRPTDKRGAGMMLHIKGSNET